MEVVVGVVRGVVVVGGARATNTTPKSKHEGNTKWLKKKIRLCDNNGIKSLEYACTLLPMCVECECAILVHQKINSLDAKNCKTPTV